MKSFPFLGLPEAIRAAFFALIFLSVNALALQSQAPANQPVFRPTQGGKQDVSQYFEYLEDSFGEFTIADVVKKKRNFFKPNGTYPTGIYTDTVYWLRITIDLSNYSAQNSPTFFTKEYKNTGRIDLFYEQSGEFKQITFDETKVGGGRAIPVRNIVFEIPPQAAPTEYYIRHQAQGNHQLVFDYNWAGLQGLITDTHDSQFVFGLFFGALVVMFGYNLFLLYYSRSRVYVHYTYYLCSLIIIFYYLNGYHSLWTSFNEFLGKLFVIVLYALLHGMLKFTQSALELEKESARLNRVFDWAAYALLTGVMLTLFIPSGPAFHWATLYVALVNILVAGTSIKRIVDGDIPARLFAVGWLILALNVFTYIAQHWKLLPPTVFTEYGMQAGAVWESICFSLVLGYRNRIANQVINDELARSAAVMAKSVSAKNQFWAMISHEVRTPLHTIIGNIEILKLRITSPKDLKVIDRMAEAAAQMTTQMKDINDHAKMDAAKLQLRLSRFHPAEVVKAIVENYKVPAQEKNLTLTFTSENSDQKVISDQYRLQQIVTNLVSNAVKYCHDAQIYISVAVITSRGKNTLRLIVKDTGDGIAPENLKSIFEPFTQILDPKNPSRKQDGAGMGLAIVKTIVSAFEGTVTVTSKPGRGARFEVNLPLQVG